MKTKLLIVAVTGFVAGAALIAVLSGEPADEGETSTTAPSPGTPTTDGAATADGTTTTRSPPTTSSTVPPPRDGGVLLAWTSGGLPAGFATAVAAIDAVDSTSVVLGEQLDLVRVVAEDGSVVEEHTDGWAIPLDVLAFEPTAHARFVTDPAALDHLRPGQALLTDTSAALRRVGVGAMLELRSGQVEIVGIVSDIDGAGAELIVHQGDASQLGLTRERYLLLQFHGDRQAIQRAIDDTLDDLGASEPIRFRTPAETTWLRHGDAVLPAALVKAGHGEFAYRDLPGRSVETAQTWTDENIVAADLPVVGTVRCHENVIDALDSAFTQLSEAGLAYLVESTEVTGCFVPRRIAESLPLSRHSWGIAIDLNVGDNRRSPRKTHDSSRR